MCIGNGVGGNGTRGKGSCRSKLITGYSELLGENSSLYPVIVIFGNFLSLLSRYHHQSSRLGVPSALVDRVSKKVSSGFILVVDRLTRPLHLTHTPGDSAKSLIICPCVFSEKLEFTNVDSTVHKILRSLWPPVFPRLESIFCDPPAFQFNSSHAIHFKITTGE